MRFLLSALIAMLVIPVNAQSLWRNFFTTNQNPIVEVVAGSNATVQASTVGSNLRRFTVNSTGSGTPQTNISYSAVTNAPWQQGSSNLTNWSSIPTNYVPPQATHATNADNSTTATYVTTATLTNQMYASNVVSGGQLPAGTVAAIAAPADGWILGNSNALRNWTRNGGMLTNIPPSGIASNTPSAGQVLTATSAGDAKWNSDLTLNSLSASSANLTNVAGNGSGLTNISAATGLTGIVPVIQLASNSPAANQVLTATSASTAAWQAPSVSANPSPSSSYSTGPLLFNPMSQAYVIQGTRYWTYTEHFNKPALFNISATASGAGSGYYQTTSETNSFGVYLFTSGTSATGYVGMGVNSGATAKPYYANSNSMWFDTRLKLSGTNQNAAVYAGFSDALYSAKPANGAYFWYDNTNSLSWQCCTVVGSTVYQTSSGVQPVANTYQNFTVHLTGNTNVIFSINGTPVFTNTTAAQIYTGRCEPVVIMTNMAAGSAINGTIDYFTFFYDNGSEL